MLGLALALDNWHKKGQASTPSNSAPTNTVAPNVTGTAVVGSVLTTDNGTWTGSPTSYAYQWNNSATGDIVGANTNSYTLVSGDTGDNILCKVTATNAIGSNTANSNSIGPIGSGAGTASLDFSQASNSMYAPAI